MKENKCSPRHHRPTFKEALQHAGSLVSKVHPACNAIPKISRQDFDNLVDSIIENGLLEPICINHNKVLLDGRSRLMACLVAGVAITTDDVKVTDHNPDAIAQSNVARRHLTKTQKLMKATDRLAEQRKLSAKRRAEGAKKGRENKNQPVRAENAPSQPKKNRGTRAVEQVAKEESVPRPELILMEKVLTAAPELRDKIESEEISLDEAADIADVPHKQPKTSKPKKPKSSPPLGERIAVIEHDDDVQELKAPGVSVFTHPQLDTSVMLFGSSSETVIGATDDDEFVLVSPETDPVDQAIESLRKKLTQG